MGAREVGDRLLLEWLQVAEASWDQGRLSQPPHVAHKKATTGVQTHLAGGNEVGHVLKAADHIASGAAALRLAVVDDLQVRQPGQAGGGVDARRSAGMPGEQQAHAG